MEIQILNRKTSEITTHASVDEALRTLIGVDDEGDRVGKVLLDSPSRRTHKQAVEIMDRNGYQIHRDQIAPKMEIKQAVATITADEMDAVTGFKLLAELLVRFGLPNVQQPAIDQAAIEKIVDERVAATLRKMLGIVSPEQPTTHE